eukprot:5695500-Amphidinium_carterae.1
MTGNSWVGHHVAAIRLCSIGTVVDERAVLDVSLAQPVPLTRRERWWRRAHVSLAETLRVLLAAFIENKGR